ncbi:unnamed protein product, partial [Amoebophrya sp. A25]|eukprot:GSA25T00024422001.1
MRERRPGEQDELQTYRPPASASGAAMAGGSSSSSMMMNVDGIEGRSDERQRTGGARVIIREDQPVAEQAAVLRSPPRPAGAKPATVTPTEDEMSTVGNNRVDAAEQVMLDVEKILGEQKESRRKTSVSRSSAQPRLWKTTNKVKNLLRVRGEGEAK